MQRRISPVQRALPCQFHWLEHDRMSTRRFLRAIPTAVFFRRTFSCLLFVGCFANSLRIVHGIDFGSIPRIDGIAADFTIDREQPVLRRKSVAENHEITNLPVMRQLWIDGIQRRLHRRRFDRAAHQSAKIPAPIPYRDDLLGRRKKPPDFFLDGFGRNVMSGIQDDQILDAAADAPIPTNVYFALIAGVEPSVLQDTRSFFRAVPITGKNVRPAHNDLIVLADLHLDSTNHRADIARLDRHARVIQRANAGSFRQPIRLQHRNSEHQKKLLRIRSERRGTADQRSKMRAKALANLSKDEPATKAEPKCIVYVAAPYVVPLPAYARFRKEKTHDRGPLRNRFFDATAHALQQSRYIQKIIR